MWTRNSPPRRLGYSGYGGPFTTLYSFTGGADGDGMYSGVALGADSTCYGGRRRLRLRHDLLREVISTARQIGDECDRATALIAVSARLEA